MTTADAERLTRLHADEEVRYRVLVPAELADVLLVRLDDQDDILIPGAWAADPPKLADRPAQLRRALRVARMP